MSEEESQQPNIFKRLFHRKQQENVRETIEDLMEEVAESGEADFSEHEQLLLNNVLDLHGRKCENAMIPRAEIVAFPKDGSVMDLADLMVEQGHSRIPIYGESMDDIIGIVHVIDLVRSVLQKRGEIKAGDIVSDKIKFVSPEKGILDLLKEMQQDKIHMAMVVDEYGGIDGLVTIEDLLEEIVGDIEDEYDHEDEPIICKQNNGNVVAEGKAELNEIKNLCGIDLYDGLPEDLEDDVDTINSLIFHIIQRVPVQGEIINGLNGVKFRIMEADPTQIKKVMIIKPKVENDN